MVSLSNHERFAVVALLAAFAVCSCGRKGPPLPPLLKQPSPPAEMRAERHGDVVDVQFVVPAANSDGSRPANVTRIDVYGLTAARAVDEAEVIKYGTKIGSVAVKAPRDPNQTVEADETDEVELQGKGLDPGAPARVEERLTADVLKPVSVAAAPKKDDKNRPPVLPHDGPLVAPAVAMPTRVYVGVTVTTKGRNGPAAHAVVAMIDAPPAPAEPVVSYDEKTITVQWTPIQVGMSAASTPAPGVLESRPLGVSVPSVAYNVYEVSDATPPVLSRLTSSPVKETRMSDNRIAWGERRCYVVRAYVTIEDASLEGTESPPRCVTLTDTFPPAAPKGLQAVPSEGAINLIWDANAESDIRGYIVLRGPVSESKLEPLFKEPIHETSYPDRAPTGVRFAYAVQAVDNAGNLSPPSARVEETAR